MKARDQLLEDLKRECSQQLAQVSSNASSYASLLKNLIIQGLIKIEEQEVEVQCRPEDKAVVSKLLPSAIADYSAIMKAKGHAERGAKPKVSISATDLPSKGCAGGVVLTACNNRIVLNQTLDEYVDKTYL